MVSGGGAAPRPRHGAGEHRGQHRPAEGPRRYRRVPVPFPRCVPDPPRSRSHAALPVPSRSRSHAASRAPPHAPSLYPPPHGHPRPLHEHPGTPPPGVVGGRGALIPVGFVQSLQGDGCPGAAGHICLCVPPTLWTQGHEAENLRSGLGAVSPSGACAETPRAQGDREPLCPSVPLRQQDVSGVDEAPASKTLLGAGLCDRRFQEKHGLAGGAGLVPVPPHWFEPHRQLW